MNIQCADIDCQEHLMRQHLLFSQILFQHAWLSYPAASLWPVWHRPPSDHDYAAAHPDATLNA